MTITQDNRWVDEQGRGVDPFSLPTFADLVFPILHGPYGEDGTIQGLLELLRLPYVGCGVTASAVCMDKVLQKNVCQSYSIPLVPYFWFTRREWDHDQEQVLKSLSQKFPSTNFPLFVKPANQGSSVGITKAHNQVELISGIETALIRDTKVVVEIAVSDVREIECAVLDPNDSPQASVLGEIIPDREFYDYSAKYADSQSQAIIPAQLSKKLTEQIQSVAIKAFRVLDCYGLARLDFLVNGATSEFYLNEVNTMPGFTPISMYPKLWEATGLAYSDLLDRLIELAFARFREKSALNLIH
ncbi:MAG: D-alanine-D-alanine ligase [Microgenomates group bacterium GW2011_GWA1_46_7]|nr:MAG: D-alanine-D-alanine ligase [Microgenomates group bacterium GW2011_GWA1_46_7]